MKHEIIFNSGFLCNVRPVQVPTCLKFYFMGIQQTIMCAQRTHTWVAARLIASLLRSPSPRGALLSANCVANLHCAAPGRHFRVLSPSPVFTPWASGGFEAQERCPSLRLACSTDDGCFSAAVTLENMKGTVLYVSEEEENDHAGWFCVLSVCGGLGMVVESVSCPWMILRVGPGI